MEVEGDQKRKLITQLQPDTEYSFVLMSRGNGAGAIQQQVSIRTAPDLLNFKPALYPSDVEEDGQVVIALPQVPAAAAPARSVRNQREVFKGKTSPDFREKVFWLIFDVFI